MSRKPRPPRRIKPARWEHYELWQNIRRALFSCPDRFTSPTNIEGLLATDIFTLNTALASTIEEAMVNTLNDLRSVWDPKNEYETYAFVRQPQRFPDVIFRQVANGEEVLLGIELKSWYLLAKEEVPTYRFTVTQAACNRQDLLVVIPWVLSNILAGSPVLFQPFVESALYCARQRNHYWLYERQGRGNTGKISSPSQVTPYPHSKSNISDRASDDGGGNFGRLARYGVMDDYIVEMQSTLVRGISVRDWQTFFKAHTS